MKPYTRNIEQHKHTESITYFAKECRQCGPEFRSQGKRIRPKYTRPVNVFRERGHEFIDE